MPPPTRAARLHPRAPRDSGHPLPLIAARLRFGRPNLRHHAPKIIGDFPPIYKLTKAPVNFFTKFPFYICMFNL